MKNKGQKIVRDTNPHITLLHHGQVPAEILDEFCTSVDLATLRFERISRSVPSPQMGVEWLAFPAIAVFLLKAYFQGFMNEAGKDHYHVLRRALKALWGKLFSKDRKFQFAIVTASGVKKLEYSMLFAIYAEIDDGNLVKLLIREDCSEDEYNASVEAFLDFVKSYHSEKPNDKYTINLNSEGGNGNITLVTYDVKSKSLRNVNPAPGSKGDKSKDG